MRRDFDHTTPQQRVVFAQGQAAARTRSTIDESEGSRVLLIASASSRALADSVAGHSRVVARIDQVAQHVPSVTAAAAVSASISNSVDTVVAVGGGSAMGLAKIVGVRTGAAIIAVPTTYSGSEATDTWGITENGRKETGADPRALPQIVIYDSILLASLSPRQRGMSGVNAIAHAIDSLWAPRADPINRAHSAEALHLLLAGLRATASLSDDAAVRESMLCGAYLAGVAFASAGAGLHHKICHVLGGMFDLPHAETHAVILPYVVEYNAPAAPEAAAVISQSLGGTGAAIGLWRLRGELGGPPSLRSLGLGESQIARAVEAAAEAAPASNPRPVTADDLRILLRRAWRGDPVV
ncbi:maleylacetate reductase [Microbacterium sp. SSM24]|uniref:maleylacetate reductase n=1 Tax=Microbacterium sp. SSM24 TaxID=2991714 RepID=UPI00222721A4|nr:maleylacetate reductase [Microbacterium sp. SSM24]MCW3492650.1 maleylacetate reductase [Microbacterium sp. SSM24]